MRGPCTGLGAIMLTLGALAGVTTAGPARAHAREAARDAALATRDAELDLHDAKLDLQDAELDLAPDPMGWPGPPIVAPPIGEVLAVAYVVAGLDHDPGPGFARRARLAGLVPLVSVRTGRNARWRDDEPDIGRGTAVEVRATWRLDRLVFEPRELHIVALVAARRRERRQLATHVIRTYFAWRHATAAAAGARSTSRAAAASAELDALTDEWFSEAVGRSRRSASEPRTARSPVALP